MNDINKTIFRKLIKCGQSTAGQPEDGQPASPAAHRPIPRRTPRAARTMTLAQMALAVSVVASTAPPAEAVGSAPQYYFDADGLQDGSDDATALPASRSVAVGANARAVGPASVAVGNLTTATDWGTIAIGSSASAVAYDAIAIGDSAVAGERAALAAGVSAIARQFSTAVGAYSAALGDTSSAFGSSTLASGTGAVALGAGARATNSGALASGYLSTATGLGAIAVGDSAMASGMQAMALGNSAQAFGEHGFAAGAFSSASDEATALGTSAAAAQSGATAIGASSVANGRHAAAIGNLANATGYDSFAAGAISGATDEATAVGAYASATGRASLALGYQALALHDNSVALGAGSATLVGAQSGYVGYGLSGSQFSQGEVNVGQRTISGVAAGAADADAVNVAQLKAVDSKVDRAAALADGTLTYDRHPDGSVNRGSVTLEGDAASGGTAIHNVADARDARDAVNLGQLSALIGNAVDNISVNAANPFFGAEGNPDAESALASGAHSVAAGANAQASGASAIAMGANSNASGNHATALGASASAGADNSVALGYGSVADRANSVSMGADGAERQLTHIAPGVQGTDAVNLNQLNQSLGGTLAEANRYTDDKIRSARRDAYGGTAAALAVAGLPQAVLPGRGMVAIGGGTYGGQSAVALGVSQLSDTGQWVYKVQGTASSRGELGASVGAGMHW